MKKLTYITGSTVEVRRRLLSENMTAKGASADNTLHIVPTRDLATVLQSGINAFLGTPVDTLSSICRRIFEEHLLHRDFREYSYMDGPMKELAVKAVLAKRSGEPEGLKYFSSLLLSAREGKEMLGVYRHIIGFFSLLVNNNLEDRFIDRLYPKMDRLDGARPGAGEERYAMDVDLALLFGDYEEFKRKHLLYDEDDITASVKSFLNSGASPGLLKDIQFIVLEGFISLTRAEEDILFRLFECAREVLWSLDLDPNLQEPVLWLRKLCQPEEQHGDPGNEALRIYKHTLPLMERLNNGGLHTSIKGAECGEFKNPFARGLYRSGEYDSSAEKDIKIDSFNTRVDEVRGICREIKNLSIQRDMNDLGGIRVIFPDLEEYYPIVYEIFPEYGIPFNISRGFSLVSVPVFRVFQLLMDIPLNGFRRQDVYSFFHSGLVSPLPGNISHGEWMEWFSLLKEKALFFAGEDKDDLVNLFMSGCGESGQDMDINFIDQVAGQCGIRGGDVIEDWLSHAGDYFSFLYQGHTRGPDGCDILHRYHIFLHQMFHLRKNTAPFRELPIEGGPMAIAHGLLNLLHRFRVRENLFLSSGERNLAGMDRSERITGRDVKSFTALKELVVKSARQIERADSFAPGARGISGLERIKKEIIALAGRTTVKDDPIQGAVNISEWTGMAGQQCEIIFAGGLDSGHFPLKDPEDFVIPESLAGSLRRMDLEDQSRHLFSHLLRNYSKNLFLSWPGRVGEKEVQPSPVLLDMASMVPCNSAEELKKLFPWDPPACFASGQEFLNTMDTEKRTSFPAGKGGFFHGLVVLGENEFLNESVIRGVRSLMGRATKDGLTEYDGLVFSSNTFSRYRENMGEVFSASRLDMIANCPMHYLFGQVFSLEPIEEMEVVSFRDMGTHVHSILKLIFDQFKKHGAGNIASLGLEKAFEIARATGEQYFSRLRYLQGFDIFPSIKRDILDGLETTSLEDGEGLPKREGILSQLLRFEENVMHQEQVIEHESRFGGDRSPVRLGNTRVRGYIDRVDKLSGQEDIFHIYDYKTGRKPQLAEIKKGLSFQLPCYLSALRGLGAEGVAARYYMIKRDSFLRGETLTSPVLFNISGSKGVDLSGITLIGDYADRLRDQIASGVFHYSADMNPCAYCDFKYACYGDSRRMRHLVDSGTSAHIYSGRKNMELWEKVQAFQKRWKEIRKTLNSLSGGGKKSGDELARVSEFKRWLEQNGKHLHLEPEYIHSISEEIEQVQARLQGKGNEKGH